MSSTKSCSHCGTRSTDLQDGLCSKCRSIHAVTIAPSTRGGTDETLAPSTTFSAGPVSGDFGEYELMEEVGRGGMGVIYKARHRKLNRIAALKMILGGRFSSDEELQRFHVEAEAAARLDHPGIVPVFEIGEHEGQAFFAMKFIEGGSLADQIDRFRSEPEKAMALLAKVARAVHHAHQRGILHRDLKPANILISEYDEPLVTDLGLAKKTAGGSDLTNTGAVLGTPSYMPPEQASGNATITTAADIYSLGAIMYELLTGVPPFKGSTAMETLMQVINDSPEPPHKRFAQVDRDLELICLKCLDQDPEARYGSAIEFASDLEAWLRGDAIGIKAPSLVSLVSRWFRQNEKLVYGGFAVLTGLLLTLPFVLALMGGQGDIGDSYSHFPAEQRPWMFSLFTVRKEVFAFAMAFLFFVLWPAIGLLNALIARPKTKRRAIGVGIFTSLVLSVVLFLLLGWMILLQGSVNASNDQIRVLADAVWHGEGASDDALATANQLYGGVEHIPLSDRAEIVTKRITNDQIGSAPSSAFIFVVAWFIFSVPVIYGTFLGHVAIQRGNRIWLCVIRYVIAWWLVSIALVMLLVVFTRLGGRINGLPASEFQLRFSFLAFLCVSAAYLTLRQWRRAHNAAR